MQLQLLAAGAIDEDKLLDELAAVLFGQLATIYRDQLVVLAPSSPPPAATGRRLQVSRAAARAVELQTSRRLQSTSRPVTVGLRGAPTDQTERALVYAAALVSSRTLVLTSYKVDPDWTLSSVEEVAPDGTTTVRAVGPAVPGAPVVGFARSPPPLPSLPPSPSAPRGDGDSSELPLVWIVVLAAVGGLACLLVVGLAVSCRLLVLRGNDDDGKANRSGSRRVAPDGTSATAKAKAQVQLRRQKAEERAERKTRRKKARRGRDAAGDDDDESNDEGDEDSENDEDEDEDEDELREEDVSIMPDDEDENGVNLSRGSTEVGSTTPNERLVKSWDLNQSLSPVEYLHSLGGSSRMESSPLKKEMFILSDGRSVGPLSTWRVDDVLKWVSSTLELPEYVASFQKCSVDGTVLSSLTKDDILLDLGVKNKMHGKKIQSHLELLRLELR